MIKASFIRSDDKLIKIEISGHANYKDNNDIVCAAVSTAIIVTINAIEKFDKLSNIDFKLEEGYLKLKVLNCDPIVMMLLENLDYSINDLAIQYPKNVLYSKE